MSLERVIDMKNRIGTDALYHSRTGALNDNKILELLRELPNMYENGEIIEVRDVCLGICNAIEDFYDSKDKYMVSKSDVLDTYAELYDVFDDNKEIQKELNRVYDKLNKLT